METPTRPRRGPRARPGAEELGLGRGHGARCALPNANALSVARQSPETLPDLRGPPPWPELSPLPRGLRAHRGQLTRHTDIVSTPPGAVAEVTAATAPRHPGSLLPRCAGRVSSRSASREVVAATHGHNRQPLLAFALPPRRDAGRSSARDVPRRHNDRLRRQVLRGQAGRWGEAVPVVVDVGTWFADEVDAGA